MQDDSFEKRKNYVKKELVDELEGFLEDNFEDPAHADIMIEKQSDGSARKRKDEKHRPRI